MLTSLKKLVDDFEEIIDFAKGIRYASDRKLIKGFIQRLSNALDKTSWLLEEYGKATTGDPLMLKYIQTYHAYLTMVTIPYLKDLLYEALFELEKKGFREECDDLRVLHDRISLFLKASVEV
jgi:hypothetical protein